MRETLVLLVVGLTPRLIGRDTPNLAALAARGALRPLTTVLPAVTCTVQSTLLTGSLPRDHGIVAIGWYFRDLAEVALWKQSNRLVAGEKLWEAGRRSRWIARATGHVRQSRRPTLTLCYLPHLDYYGLQKYGPDPEDPRMGDRRLVRGRDDPAKRIGG